MKASRETIPVIAGGESMRPSFSIFVMLSLFLLNETPLCCSNVFLDKLLLSFICPIALLPASLAFGWILGRMFDIARFFVYITISGPGDLLNKVIVAGVPNLSLGEL